MTHSSPPSIQIRPAQSPDAEAITAIYNHYVRVGGATFDTQPWEPHKIAALIGHPLPEAWYVAQDGSTIIGWASVRRYSERFGYRFTCETAIYLAPSALGKNVGHALQQRVDKHCRDNQLHHAVARIIADNHRSLSFHRRFGYQVVGIQKEIGHMNGRWVDVAILQKVFSD